MNHQTEFEKMKTPQEILDQMESMMPYVLADAIAPYVLEAITLAYALADIKEKLKG